LAQALKAAQQFVQQPCSNPSEYPENSGIPRLPKFSYFSQVV
jgi:hypothetical protein